MSKQNKSGSGNNVAIKVTFDIKTLKSTIKEIITEVGFVEKAVGKTNEAFAKLNDKKKVGGFLDLLKQIEINTRGVNAQMVRAVSATNDVTTAIKAKNREQLVSVKHSQKLAEIEKVYAEKAKLLNIKLMEQDKVRREKQAEYAKSQKKELTEEEKAIKALQGSSNGLLSHFEKGIIVANQFAELMRKIQQFAGLMMKPVMEAGQFEQWQVALKNLTGSEEIADKKFREMIQFAKVTPFTIPGIIETGMRLEALGRYSLNTIRMLGDLAAASGKDVSQAVEAYSNLVTGRTGIAIKQFRAMLIATSDWTRITGKQVLQNAKGAKATITEMLEALPKIIAQKNFTGLMEAQSKTFLGKLTNLQDSIQTFLAKVGESFLDTSKDIVTELTNIFNSFSTHAQDIGSGVRWGGWALLAGAVVTLSQVVIKSGASIIMFFKNLQTAGMAAGLANMPLTSIAALVVAFAAVIGGIGYYFATMKKTNKEMLEFNENLLFQKESLQKELSTTNDVIRNHIKLIETYQRLKKETRETGVATKEFKDASDKVAAVMPGIALKYDINSTGAKRFDDALDALSNSLRDNGRELTGLQTELDTINFDIAKFKFFSFADEIKGKFDTVFDDIKERMAARDFTSATNISGANKKGDTSPLGWGWAKLGRFFSPGGGMEKPVKLAFTQFEGAKTTTELLNAEEELRGYINQLRAKLKDATSLEDMQTLADLGVILNQLKTAGLQKRALILTPSVKDMGSASKIISSIEDIVKGNADKGIKAMPNETKADKEKIMKFYQSIKKMSDAHGGLTDEGDNTGILEITKDKKFEKLNMLVYNAVSASLDKAIVVVDNEINDEQKQIEQGDKDFKDKLQKFVIATQKDMKRATLGYEVTTKRIENMPDLDPEQRAYLNTKSLEATNIELTKILKDAKSQKAFAATQEGENVIETIKKEIEKNKTTINEITNSVFGEMVDRMNAAGEPLDDIRKYIDDAYKAMGGVDFDIKNATESLKKKFEAILSKKTEFDTLVKSLSEGNAELDIQKLNFATPEGITNAKALITKTLSSGAAGLSSAGMLSDIIQSSVDAGFVKRTEDAKKIENDDQRRIALKNIEVDKQKIIEELLQYLLDAIETTPKIEGLTAVQKAEMELKTNQNRSKITKDKEGATGKRRSVEAEDIRLTKEADAKAWQERLQFANQALGQMTDAYNMFYDNARQKITEEVDAWKKAALEKIDIEQKRAYEYARTAKQKERIDEVYAKKKDAIEKEANKKKSEQMKVWFEWDKAIKIAQTSMNTAMAIMNVWATLPAPAAAIMTGVIGALGLTQIAAIAAQEMPEGGFAEGGYTGDIPEKKKAGVVHGKEFVVNAKSTKKNRGLLEAMNDGDFSVADMLARGKNDLLGITAPLSVRRDFMIVNELKRNDTNLINELRDLKEVFIQYAGAPVVIGDDDARRITGLGIKKIRKSSF